MADPQIVEVIGAPRSGTKLLRDLLASHRSIDRVPYDVNFVWRYGNEGTVHDRLDPATAVGVVKQHIRRRIFAFGEGAPFLVEKTVSNAVRVPFVWKVMPEAKYIHLFRNGRDVVESICRQWNARPDWRYIIAKGTSYPMLDGLRYGMDYLRNAVKMTFGRKRGDGDVWGVRYAGIDEDLRARPLIEVCALQWLWAVRLACSDLDELDSEAVMYVRYEDLVADPWGELTRVGQFLGLLDVESFAESAVAQVTAENVGRGPANMSAEEMAAVDAIILEGLKMLGYVGKDA